MAGFTDIFKVLIGPLLGFAGGAMQGDPYQKKQGFTGEVSPPTMLRDYMHNVQGAGTAATTALNQGTQRRPLVSSTPGFANLDPGATDPAKLRTPGPGMSAFGVDPTQAGPTNLQPAQTDAKRARRRRVED